MSKMNVLSKINGDCHSIIVSMKGIKNTDTLYLLGLRIGWILTGRTIKQQLY